MLLYLCGDIFSFLHFRNEIRTGTPIQTVPGSSATKKILNNDNFTIISGVCTVMMSRTMDSLYDIVCSGEIKSLALCKKYSFRKIVYDELSKTFIGALPSGNV